MESVRRFRIVVFEKQLIIGKAICHLLAAENEFEIAADVSEIDERMLKTLAPDLLLLDLDSFDEIDTIIEAIRRSSPASHTAVLTSSAVRATMQHCIACGIDGFIVKDVSPTEFVRACKSVARGETYFDPRLAGEYLRRLNYGIPAQDELSVREAEIVRLIALGLSNREIGERLVLAEKTVKNHITRIFAKLQVTARTQAAIYAIRNGLA